MSLTRYTSREEYEALCESCGISTDYWDDKVREQGKVEDVKCIIDRFGSDKDSIISYNNYILRKLFKEGNFNLVDYLVDRFNLQIDDIRLPTQEACSWGKLDMLKYIVVKFNMQIDNLRIKNDHALFWPSVKGHLEIVQFIIDHFNLNRDNVSLNDIHQVIEISCRYGQFRIAEFIKKHFQV